MSEDDVVDAFGIDPAAFDQRLDDRGAQLPRRQRGKAAAEFPDGGPKRRNDGGSTQCHDVNSCRFNGGRVYGLGRWLARKSGGLGKRVSVRVDLGGRRIITKKHITEEMSSIK